MTRREARLGPVGRAFSFRGRTSRSEYGKVYVGLLVAAFVAKGVSLTPLGDTVLKVAGPCLLVPLVGASVRRLHDSNRSGHTMWLLLIPFVGAIMLLVRLFEPGNEGVNRYGAPPRRGPGEPTSAKPLHRRTYLDADGRLLRSEVVDATGEPVDHGATRSE